MERISTPNIDPPPNLINLKYVNSCNCKLHTVSRPVSPFTPENVCRAVRDKFEGTISKLEMHTNRKTALLPLNWLTQNAVTYLN